MQFNTMNNNTKDTNVTTKIRTFYGELSCLQLAYWNENISIKINPLLSVNEEGIRQYDYNRKASTALTTDKCLALASKIEEKILPAIKAYKETKNFDKPVNTGFIVGNKNSALFIEWKADNSGVPYVFLTFYTNISQDGVAPKDGAFSYKFAKLTANDDYDPETGTSTSDTIDAEFLFFYDKIKHVADIFGTAAHSCNVNNAFKEKRSGNSNNTYTQQNNNGNFGNSNFGNNASQSNQYAAPVGSFDASQFPIY